MKEQEWSYSELEKEFIKDFKRSLVDVVLAGSRRTVDWKLDEQEKEEPIGEPGMERKKRTFIVTLERTQNGKKLDWTAKTEIKAYEPPKIGTGRTLLVDPPIYETVTKIEEIVTNIVNYAENENGVNTKENELPTP